MTALILISTIILAAAHAARATAGHPNGSHNPRYQVAAQLNRALAGTPMARTGYQLEAAGWRWKIHPAFIAAIAGTESTFGAAACRSNRYNAFGLASCGTSWPVPDFQSWADAYDFMGRFLTGNTRVTTGWPRARTPHDYNGYAACTPCWGRKTAYWMRHLGFPPDVRYGR